MSLHSSLSKRNKKYRSVLNRRERLAKAIKEGKWKVGDSVFALPKFNPPKFKPTKIKDKEETKTALGNVDILEQHKLTKEKAKKEKKQKSKKKETTGRK